MIGCTEKWSTDNYLDFNISKCKYMIVSRKRNPPEPVVPLKLFDSALDRVDNYKYLGVLLTDNLSWSMQVESVCQKARRVLGLLYRRFYGQASQETLKQLYLSLVWPHLDYACQVWDPHLLKDKTNAYLNSFFPHTIASWNMLDHSTTASNSYKSFMHHIRN